MKKFTLLFCLALIHLSSFAQCDIPSSSTTNTGANMTVLLQPAFINSLPPMSGNDYLVARTQDGLTVGVIYWIDPDPESLAYLSLGTNVSLAIWGDDTGTPEVVDGAAANELISFQVVSGTTVYNGEFPTPINYTTNGMSFQTTSAETALCIVGCMDDTADNYDPDAIFYSGCITSCTDCACEGDIPEYVSLEPTGSNMSILLHSSFIESLPPFLTENSYIIATGSASGQIAGTALLGPEFRDGDQALLAIWSDDGLGSNVGLVGGDSIIFTYYDGPNVYNVDLMYSMDGTGDLISSITDPLIFINNGILTANGSHFNQTCEIADFSIPGCMDEDACNYYESATDDDGTCLVPDECNECVGEELSLIDTDANGVCDLLDIGCSEPDACNYNELATSNYDACIYSTDLDACASCSGDTDGTGTIVDNDADNDGICDADEQERCADISACNYNDDTTFDTNDDLCIYTEDACDTCSGETDGTGSIVDNDADDDTYCDADDVFPNDPAEWLDTDDDGLGDNADILSGCTEPTACNYDASTTVNTDNTVCNIPDGICESCSGETDGTGTIVDNDADDDTYCDADDVFPNDPAEWLDTDGDGLGDNADILSGCTDDTACNYDASTTVNTDSASCIFSTDLDACATCSGETDGSGTIVDNDDDDDSVCNADEIEGCTEESACNYDATPTTDTDNDLCIYAVDLDACASCSGEQDGTGTIVDNDADDDTYCDTDDAFPNDPAEWLDTDGDGLGDNADILSGCTDSTACNYNASTTVNTDIASCIYSTDLDACATCSGETDGSGIIVNGDADNDGLCDIYEVYGCVNPLATNYNANISPTDADDSCLFDQDYSDSLSYIIDSLNLDNSFSTAHIMMLQNQVTNLEQQLDLVWIINDENQDQYEETLANLQADLAEIQAFNVDNQIAYFQNLINTDNPGPYEVVVQAYMVIAEAYEECNPNVYGLIENYLNLGWNTIGYNVLYATPVEYQFASIINDVVLVKNNGGEIYWPYYNFNAIGDMIPGQGYQVRVSSVVDDFRFVE